MVISSRASPRRQKGWGGGFIPNAVGLGDWEGLDAMSMKERRGHTAAMVCTGCAYAVVKVWPGVQCVVQCVSFVRIPDGCVLLLPFSSLSLHFAVFGLGIFEFHVAAYNDICVYSLFASGLISGPLLSLWPNLSLPPGMSRHGP